MHQIENVLELLVQTIQDNLALLLIIILGLWILQFVNRLLRYRLNLLGIIPRSVHGLVGIIFSPFLHGSAEHLFFNTIPLIVFACFILVGGKLLFFQVSLTIILLSGGLVWLFGRHAIHIGASGLIMGYWGYLLINAYHQPNLLTIALAVVSIYYFGGLFFGLFPSKERVSWEGHLFGCMSGIVANYIFPMAPL